MFTNAWWSPGFYWTEGLVKVRLLCSELRTARAIRTVAQSRGADLFRFFSGERRGAEGTRVILAARGGMGEIFTAAAVFHPKTRLVSIFLTINTRMKSMNSELSCKKTSKNVSPRTLLDTEFRSCIYGFVRWLRKLAKANSLSPD